MSKAIALSSFRALMLASGVVLSACGPAPTETEALEESAAPAETVTAGQEDRPVSALDTIPPSSSLSCSRNRFTGDVNCTGTGMNGIPPYRYQWRYAYDYESDGYSDPGYWFDGGQTATGYCPFGFHADGYYWAVTISFRVIDANGYISTNAPSQRYNCATATGPGGV